MYSLDVLEVRHRRQAEHESQTNHLCGLQEIQVEHHETVDARFDLLPLATVEIQLKLNVHVHART